MTVDDSQIASIQGPELIGELRTLIQAARTRVATAANAELTMLCWRIGKRRCMKISAIVAPTTAGRK